VYKNNKTTQLFVTRWFLNYSAVSVVSAVVSVIVSGAVVSGASVEAVVSTTGGVVSGAFVSVVPSLGPQATKLAAKPAVRINAKSLFILNTS
jgi:hypothetical protein